MSVHCFMIHPTERDRRWLRRYHSRTNADGAELDPCAGPDGYHQARVRIEDGVALKSPEGYHYSPKPDRSDPRWPVQCEACGYRFADTDEWQVFCDLIYTDAAGAEYTLRDGPPGAMLYAWWLWDPRRPEDLAELPAMREAARAGNKFLSIMYLEQWAEKRPPLQVFCPNGRPWIVDATANNGPGWTVTGEPPLITCAPSIAVTGYHGFLQGGVFTADVEGRGPMGVRP